MKTESKVAKLTKVWKRKQEHCYHHQRAKTEQAFFGCFGSFVIGSSFIGMWINIFFFCFAACRFPSLRV